MHLLWIVLRCILSAGILSWGFQLLLIGWLDEDYRNWRMYLHIAAVVVVAAGVLVALI